MRTKILEPKVKLLPNEPGVYFWKTSQGEILYIGKAKSLRKRASQYLRVSREEAKTWVLMQKAEDLDFIQTSSEVDALILEAQLIRKHQPRYNKELKDDKSFPLIKITKEKYPRIHLTRSKSEKNGIYYGPYTDAKLLREALSLIHALFPVRKCRTLPKTACLYYHIGQCIAPCIKPDAAKQYDKLIGEIRGFLGGGKKGFVDYLSDKMQEASRDLRFEDAQFYKEQIEAISKLRKKRFDSRRPERGVGLSGTRELKRLLGLSRLPEKIVCFDVSNIQGDASVASRASFYRELPDKMGYRRYKIKTVKGINDYAMIGEALKRMLKAVASGKEEFVPDLVVIDGGRGHLNAAFKILEEVNMTDLALISIAKRFEWIYRPGVEKPFALSKDSPALRLIQRLRDEAHRFAITYHRSLKSKSLRKSALDGVPGIGPVRKKILLTQFESIQELARTGPDQLAGLPGMDKRSALKILSWLSSKKTSNL